MTIQEALDRADLLRPNNQSIDFKLRWLSELDGLLCREILSVHVQDVYRITIAEGDGDPEDWNESVEIRVAKANAGANPRFDITGNGQTYKVYRNGRKQTVPAPIFEAVKHAAEIFEDGSVTISGRVYTPIDPENFTGYDAETDPSLQLIAEFPYDEIYTHYLCSKIDLQNLEIDKYNNDMELFNNAYNLFNDYWTRTHLPLTFNSELHI